MALEYNFFLQHVQHLENITTNNETKRFWKKQWINEKWTKETCIAQAMQKSKDIVP